MYANDLKAMDAHVVLVEQDTLLASELAYGLTGLFQMISLIVCAVLFIRWFRRAYENLPPLTGYEGNEHPRWTLWGFVVPVLNLFAPRRMMREVWDQTYRAWIEKSSPSQELRMPWDLVNPWWGLFLGWSVLSNFAGRLTWSADTAGKTLDAVHFGMVADTIGVVAALVAFLLVRNISTLQSQLAHQATAAGGVTESQ